VDSIPTKDVVELVVVSLNLTGCKDTANWHNGWSRCAYEQNGQDPELCSATPSTQPPYTAGWTCKAYAVKGWCSGASKKAWAMGAHLNDPEENCCVCGGGTVDDLGAPSNPCSTTVSGELCYDAVVFAMTKGIHEHPEWYPNLNGSSSLEDFQDLLHKGNSTLCPEPCAVEPEACHTAEVFEKCYTAVKWAMSDGIHSHAEWYPGVDASSTFEAFQAVLHKDPTSECPSPCAPVPPAKEQCYTSVPSETCYKSVQWAMSDGIFAHPEWYPLVKPDSSFEEFQEQIHKTNPTDCPNRPCAVDYAISPYTAYRGPTKNLVKGIAYGPSPLKGNIRLENDDFMSNSAAVQWAPWGRGDLKVMRNMGANTIRMYGNDPSVMKRSFFDQALKTGLDVIVGMSDYGFSQSADRCSLNQYYCFNQTYWAYRGNLEHGFTVKDRTAYHPALKAVIIMNEPDLKLMRTRTLMCRALITALDGMLEAEKDLGVTGNPVAFTATMSFAVDGGPPGLGQMAELYRCVQDIKGWPTYYTPKNDIEKAYMERFVNSFNTANPASSVQHEFLDKYMSSSFWTHSVKIPVFIGEYHDVHHPVEYDMKHILRVAQDPKYPFFMGVNFFEFSVRYDKGGTEMDFGMFGFGHCDIATLPLGGKNYSVWNLDAARRNRFGEDISLAVAKAYGGKAPARNSQCTKVVPMDGILGAGLPTYWES